MNKVSRKNILLIVGSCLLILLAVVAILEKTHIINLVGNANISGQKEEQEATKTAAENKATYLDQAYGKGAGIKQPTNNNPTPVAPSSLPITVELNSYQENDTITVTTKIQNVSAGTCKLRITNGSREISQEAAIIYQPEFSSCAGFGIAKSSLGNGSWDITLTATPDAGDSVVKTVTLEVQ